MRGHHGSAGLTLLELLAVVALAATLATLLFLSKDGIRNRVEAIMCMNNLRQLHNAFAAYVQDHGSWPQVGHGTFPAEDGSAWILSLHPYGAERKLWHCPTNSRNISEELQEELPNRIDYLPTQFSPGVFTPYRWSGQPWLIEIGDFHGRGAHILFPDGSIRDLNDVLGEAGLLDND